MQRQRDDGVPLDFNWYAAYHVLGPAGNQDLPEGSGEVHRRVADANGAVPSP